MKPGIAWLFVGAAALAWTGSSLAASLQMSRSVEINLAGFAVAIVLLAGAPVRALSLRVRKVEATLAAGQLGPGAPLPANER
jgi:hypothetical protein